MKKNSFGVRKRANFPRKSVISLVLAFLLLGLAIAGSIVTGSESSAASAAPQPPERSAGAARSFSGDGISPEAASQIAAILNDKRSRTAVQNKVDSNLLLEAKQRRGDAMARDLPELRSGVAVDKNSFVQVDVRAKVTPALLKSLKAARAEIIGTYPEYKSVVAKVPVSSVESIAGILGVSYVMPVDEAQFSGVSADQTDTGRFSASAAPQPVTLPGFDLRARNVRSFLASTIDNLVQSGTVTSEGDSGHRANIARSLSGANGSGLKIGVLSNGVASLAARQASGDLPATVTVLPSPGASGDEGTAMLEIVNDVAPGAQLYFATANPSSAQFAANIKGLRTAGCDIIIDDVSYFYETPFQDGQAASVTSPTNGGIIVQAVNDVTVGSQAGALYFSSAANSGNKNDGTAGVWEGDYVDGGASGSPLPAGAGQLHDFGGGATYDTLTLGGGRVILKWSDPLGASNNDYDLFILNSAGTAVVAQATGSQTGTQDPLEDAGTRNTGERVVIVKFSGSSRYLHLNSNRGRLAISTPGVTYGHNSGRNTISVAATPSGPTFNSPLAIGPYPFMFRSSNVVEVFSSDGPRRIFYNADSTPITPGNVSSTGGEVLQKPDITAADGVATTTPGFIPFYGTSAAAPHAGALAALLKSASPSSTNSQIYNAMVNGAIDIEAPGVDRDSGAGIFMPIRSMALLGLTGPALLDAAQYSSAEYLGNMNGKLDPGESGMITVPLNNIGFSNATAISATLSTSTPGAQMFNGGDTRSYANLTAATGSATNSIPFYFGLSPTFPCGGTISFALTVNYTGGTGPQVFNFTLATGAPTVISTTLDTTAPTSVTPYTASTGTQTGRLFRDGTASSCSVVKTSPGTSDAATPGRRYDAYTFTASGSGCTTVTLSNATTGLFMVAYNSSGFVPATPAANYLADAGGSNLTTSFSFNVVAGQQYTVVVNEVSVTGNPGTAYSLSVSGPVLGACQIATAASVNVAGRVTSSAGRTISNATVSMTDMNGTVRSARTNSFGYYRFDGVPSGKSYVFNATAKGYTFSPQLYTISDDISGLNLVAEP